MQNMSIESLANQRYDNELKLINHYLYADNNARDQLLARNPNLTTLLKNRYNLPLHVIYKIYTYLDIQTQNNLYTSVCKSLNNYMKEPLPYEPMRFMHFKNIARVSMAKLKIVGNLKQLKQRYSKYGNKNYKRFLRITALTYCMLSTAPLIYTSCMLLKLSGAGDDNALVNCFANLIDNMTVNSCDSSINFTNACLNSTVYGSPINYIALCEQQSNETCNELCELVVDALPLDCSRCPHSDWFTITMWLLFLLSIAISSICGPVVACLIIFKGDRVDSYSAKTKDLEVNIDNAYSIPEIDAQVDAQIESLETNLNIDHKGRPWVELWHYHKMKLAEKINNSSIAGNLARSMPMLSSSGSDDAPPTAPTTPTETTPLLINSSYYGAGS